MRTCMLCVGGGEVGCVGGGRWGVWEERGGMTLVQLVMIHQRILCCSVLL